MAIDLKKENYDENGNRKPLTVYPENDSPEIYPAREIFPQTRTKLPLKAEIAAESVPAAGVSEALPAKPRGRRKKKTAGVALVISVLFAAIIAGTLFTVTSNLTDPSGESSREEHFRQNDIQEVYIAAANADVVFEYDFNGTGTITVSSNFDGYCKASQDKGTLFVGCEGYADAYYEETGEIPAVTVKFPRRFDGKINIGGSGYCNVTAGAGGNVEINVETGNINAAGLNASYVSLSTDNGNINVYNSEFSELEMHTRAGSVNLMDSEINDSLRVIANMGNVDVRRIISSGTTVIHSYSGSHYGADIDSSIYGENLLLEGNAEFVSETGGMRLYNTDFRDLLLVSTGRVDVWTSSDESDYSIRCITDVNSTNLTDSSDGEYSLKITAAEAYFEFGGDPPDV